MPGRNRTASGSWFVRRYKQFPWFVDKALFSFRYTPTHVGDIVTQSTGGHGFNGIPPRTWGHSQHSIDTEIADRYTLSLIHI